MVESHKSAKDKHTEMETDVLKSEELLQTLLTGVSSKKDNNAGGGYMGQLAEAKARIAQGRTEEEQSRVKLGMREKELQALQKKMKEVEREAGDSAKRLKDMKAVVEQHRQRLAKGKWNAEMEEKLESQLKQLRQAVRELVDVSYHLIFDCIIILILSLLETRAYQAKHEPPQL